MSYTQREVDELIDIYTSNACLETVDRLSVKFNKPRKSIISKLVKEGVYISKGYRTKLGQIPITKLQIVRGVENVLDVKLPGLDKTPKSTLQKLETACIDMHELLEDALEEISRGLELQNIRDEMRSTLACKK